MAELCIRNELVFLFPFDSILLRLQCLNELYSTVEIELIYEYWILLKNGAHKQNKKKIQIFLECLNVVGGEPAKKSRC